MNKKAKLVIMACVEIMLFICIISVFNLTQNTSSDRYMKKAVTQRKTSHKIKDIRGKIYDRNMISFVDSRTEAISTNNGRINIPKRYDSLSLLRHIIGSVRSDGHGAGGIEEMYDSVLRDSGEVCINSLNDGSGTVIDEFFEKGFEIKRTKDTSLLLSVDYHVQKIAEDELKKSGLKGAVCIMDAHSFSPLALASRGNYDQNNVLRYLNSQEGELIDRCTSAYDAGSIFKIVTVAAALENNIVDQGFTVECNGCINIGGTEFLCHKKEGHGRVNMEEAFAKSCNVYFYELGNMVGIKNIYDTAKNFSLGESILKLPWESKGEMDILSNVMPNQIANISIGQGNLLVTPVQALNLVNIIANDGIVKTPQTVVGIVGSDGVIKEDFRQYTERRAVSVETARSIKQMMRSTMVYGTGKNYDIQNTKICAKTGTAQTGWIEGEDTMTHGWFVGFFPMEEPRISIAVFLENGKSGYNAGRVFEGITKELLRCGF